MYIGIMRKITKILLLFPLVIPTFGVVTPKIAPEATPEMTHIEVVKERPPIVTPTLAGNWWTTPIKTAKKTTDQTTDQTRRFTIVTPQLMK